MLDFAFLVIFKTLLAMRANDVTTARSHRGWPKGLKKTKGIQLTDSDDLFSLGIILSNSNPIASTPPRVSKRHKNVTIMVDRNPAVFVPLSRRKRTPRVPISCVDDVLIDTTNFSREPECTIMPKSVEINSIKKIDIDLVIDRFNCAVKLIHTTAPNLNVELPSIQTMDANDPSFETLNAIVDLPVQSNVEASESISTPPLSSADVALDIAIQSVAGTQMFLPVSDTEWKKVTEAQDENRKKNNEWAKNKFGSWRVFMGIDTSKTIEVLTYDEFRELLLKFFLAVCKSSSKRYPTGSLMGFMKAFNRLLCKEQGHRIRVTKTLEIPFDIMKNPFFIGATKSLLKSMEKSRDVGVNKGRRKVDALTWEAERKILDHPLHAITDPRGCQMRFAFYCFVTYLIQGNRELYSLKRNDFLLEYDCNNILCLW